MLFKINLWASLAAQMVKNLPAMWETQVQSLGWEKIPWRREWQPTPVFLPGESHRQRSMTGYSPWGRKESDTTERLTLTLLWSSKYTFLILKISSQSQVIMFLGYTVVFQNKIMKIYSWYWDFGMYNKICK